MSDLLVAIVLSLCSGYDTDKKGQVITNNCQETIVNCAVGKHGEITEELLKKCLKEYEESNEKQSR